MATYTYDPTKLKGSTISRVRFELGDILVDGGAETCMLCDEEIQAVLDETPKFKRVLYKLADAVCMRLSYETDWQDDGTRFSLNQRAERWLALRDKFKKEADAAINIPTSGAVNDSIRNAEDGGHYFYGGMMQNPYVKPPMPYRGDDKC